LNSNINWRRRRRKRNDVNEKWLNTFGLGLGLGLEVMDDLDSNLLSKWLYNKK